jgi:hypothetical protein
VGNTPLSELSLPKRQKIDGHAIRALSATLDRPIKTLILNDGTDPFYIGESRMRAAEWFATLYREYGFGRGVHIRRIHYRIVSQRERVQLPDGSDYINTVACSKALGEAASAARFAGFVDAGDFEDRRNPAPRLWIPERVGGPDIGTIGHYIDNDFDIGPASFRAELPSFVIPDELQAPRLVVSAPFQNPYHIEIWCEKSTIDDVLDPLAERYGLNLQTALGEISITRCRELVERAGDRPIRILYVSDFDGAGDGMPVAAARKIEWFARHQDEPLDIQLQKIVLTKEQCEEYDLPPTPAKPGDSRAPGFEERHGDEIRLRQARQTVPHQGAQASAERQ